MTFTPSQKEAVFRRGSSVLVSAGAGSGKTRVLTERLMAFIAPEAEDAVPVDLDRFLIITFTRAAAGELRGRIASAINERLRSDPGNSRLRRQLMLCANAQICTIHSFCADLLREHAAEAGISPGFKILEDERAERLRLAALDRVLEQHYEAGEQAFLQLAATVGAGRDDSRLAEQVLSLHAAVQSHADPAAWVREQTELLDAPCTDFSVTPWGLELLAETAKAARFRAGELEQCLTLMQPVDVLRKAYEASFAETAAAFRRMEKAASEGWDAVRNCLPVPFPKLGIARNNPDPELSDWVKARRDAAKKEAEKISRNIAADSADVLSQLKTTAPAMKQLLQLTLELEREFQESKQRAGALDFGDLEHRALRLLQTPAGEPTALSAQLAARYTEVMVDEYQDVSRVQDSLFHAVSRDGENLFLVGDVKQSIYRFRLADPEIFTGKCEVFHSGAETEHGEDGYALSSQGRLIRLQENFRSRREVLEAVNRTFTRCMSKELGDLDYGPEDELIPSATYTGAVPQPELILLNRSEAENGALEAEAEAVAVRILDLIPHATVEKDGTVRPLRYGDIAILLRAANNIGDVFRRVLQKHGIPVTSGAAGDFFVSAEISTALAMLSVMDNPHQDIPLLTLLRSPSLGFSDEKLSLIRSRNRDADLYTALCLSEDPEAQRFQSMLQRLRSEAPDRNPVELVERVLEALDLYAVCSAMPDSGIRLKRLTGLVQLAETFRNSEEAGLHRFVLWLRNLAQRGQEPAVGASGGDAVQILSIHKSKGLEFPVVFVSALGRAFNKMDTHATVLVHPVLGLGPRVTDPERKIEFPSAARRAIEVRLERETLSEEMRLLYVAMTRARERLFLTACVNKPEEQLERARLLLPPDGRGAAPSCKLPARLLKSASSPLQWVLPAAVFDGAFRLTGGEHTEKTEEPVPSAEPETLEADANADAEAERCLSWRYPYEAAERIPSKVTPTELKSLMSQPDPEAAVSAPRQEGAVQIRLPDIVKEKLNAAERGSAAHLVLQHIALEKAGTAEGIAEEIRRLVRLEYLTEAEASAVRPEIILAFFESRLGQRLRRADSLRREFRFSLMEDAASVFTGAANGDRILLQGVIDCCFEEDGALILIDYKTDRVENDDVLRQRTELYRPQLETYARALERIMGIPVREKYLYFLSVSREVRLG